MYRQMWKFDKEGNYTSIRKGHVYCNHCKDVKQIIETVLTERVYWTYSEFFHILETLLAIFNVLVGFLYWGMGIRLV